MTLKINGATGGSVSLDAPDNTSPAGTDVTLTLPVNDGNAGQFLQTDGTGALSWQTVPPFPDAIDVGASAPADSIAILNSGDVGIGNTSPNATLDVTGDIECDTNINIVESTATANSELLSLRNTSGTAATSQIGFYNAGLGSATTRLLGGNTSANGSGTFELQCTNNSGTAHTMMFVDNGTNSSEFQFRTNNSDRVKIQNDGRVLFGCTSVPSVSVRGSSISPNLVNVDAHRSSQGNHTGAVTHWLFINGNGTVGSIVVSGSATSYNTSSDYRLKENIVPIAGAVERLKQLKPSRFNFIADPTKTVDGFIAHEVQDVVPEAISGEKDGVEVWKEGQELPEGVSVGDSKLDENGNTIPEYQGIDQSKLVPLLTAALQEAIAKIETLETRLTALEGGAA